MRSVILQTATKYLLPLVLLFAFILLVRGHNEPGGGFVGGLVAATAYGLYSIAFGNEMAKRLLKYEPLTLIATGLAFALGSGLVALFHGEVFLTGLWATQYIPVIKKVGTPLLFDIGVFFVVFGIAVKIIFSLSEEVLEK